MRAMLAVASLTPEMFGSSNSRAIVATDIKRVLAYSTVSQLGYMFAAVGLAAYSAGIFHVFTHAFFKALLFLAAGSVMHGTDGELDIRKMGRTDNVDTLVKSSDCRYFRGYFFRR